MYSIEDLNREIDKLILGGHRHARWITQAIMGAHPVDEPNALLCQLNFNRSIVGRRMKKHADCSLEGQQLTLLGHAFEHLTECYVIERDAEDVMVDVLDMTVEEHLLKAEALDREASAKSAHAMEHRLLARLKSKAA